MADIRPVPTSELLIKLNRLVDRDVLTPSEAAWRIIESLEYNFECGDPSEIASIQLIVDSLDLPISDFLRSICATPEDRVYVRSVCADPPGPHVTRVDIDRAVTPIKIVLVFSDGESSEVQPDDSQRIVMENLRSCFQISKNVG